MFTKLTYIADTSNMQQSKNRGFLFSAHISEQQVGAAMNLLSLSKWAKHVGVSPVEPFVNESVFKWPHKWPHVQSEISRVLRFRDLFNIDYWNSMCSQFNAAPLVSYETFLSKQTKSSIIVSFLITQHCIPQQVFIDDEISDEADCHTMFHGFERASDYNINQVLQTNIVRRVCIPLCKRRFHIDTITSYVYGSLNPGEMTVIIIKWSGMMKNHRLRILESDYWRTERTVQMLHTSDRIINDSRNYVKKYLDSDFGKYVAISFRSVKRAKLLEQSEQPYFFKTCIKELGLTIDSLNSRKVFLAMDLGRFGDGKASSYITDITVKMIEHDLFQAVYKGSMTMDEWEQSFINITDGITDSGYIATLHSNILQNSGCIVMFGGDSYFQKNILYDYKQKHMTDSMCIKEVCYNP